MQQVIPQTKYPKEKKIHASYLTVILQEQTRSSICFLRHVMLPPTSMSKRFKTKPHVIISDTGIN